MAGLFGFFVRTARPRDWMADRLERLRAGMTARPWHRHHLEIHDHAAFGISGPGLHAGTLEPHQHPGGACLLAEGEVYRAGDWSSDAAGAAHAWPLVLDRWLTGGHDALASIDGVYTLARYEPATAGGPRLTLANDRWGSRRLYVLEDGDAVVFAADFAPLAAWLGAAFEVDGEFVRASICMPSVPGGRTWSSRIRLLPPATTLTLTPHGAAGGRYWTCARLPEPGNHRDPDHVDRLLDLWRTAIARRTRGDRLGQQLSGGLDSRLILATLARPHWPTVTYGDARGDEARCARRAAATVGADWSLLPQPAPDWLEQRMRLSLEHGGLLDLMNLPHAGYMARMRELMAFEISGYVGDMILGDTYSGLREGDLPWALGYWPSPVSLEFTEVERLVRGDLEGRGTWAWMFETKCRMHINWWPHVAVNDLEVRKPFVDYAFLDYAVGLPLEWRRGRALHLALLARLAPALLRVPVQKTGVRPDASRPRVLGMGAVRRAYRLAQPAAAALGVPMRPWLRGAWDAGRSLAAPDVRAVLEETLLDPNARTRAWFGREAVRATLDRTFAPRPIAHEVILNLYRVERVLQHVPRWQAGDSGADASVR